MTSVRIITIASVLWLSYSHAHAEEVTNYHECLFHEDTELNAAEANQTTSLYCASRFFDTAPTAFQALVLNQDLEAMKQRDAKFATFYNGIRKHSSNDIYSDRQIILMYIDKREVNKD